MTEDRDFGPTAVGPPTELGGYRLVGVIGAGSSGTVFMGVSPAGARVAVKVLSPDLRSDPLFVARFRTEAAVMRKADHPNCVRIVELIDQASVIAIVSELVHGASLQTVLDTAGPLTGEQALGVLQGALSGLSHLHALGLVHRDVKPANILVDLDGVSKLTDFGLARPMMQNSPQRWVVGAGTPAYMSPEQVRGDPLDHRSDIYACGAVLFEALTGRRAFVGGSIGELSRLHTNEPPPDPRSVRPELHPSLASLVINALAKDPAERQQSAEDLLRQLEAAAAEAHGLSWKAKAKLTGAAAAALLAGAASLGDGTGTGVAAKLVELLPELAGTELAGAATTRPGVPDGSTDIGVEDQPSPRGRSRRNDERPVADPAVFNAVLQQAGGKAPLHVPPLRVPVVNGGSSAAARPRPSSGVIKTLGIAVSLTLLLGLGSALRHPLLDDSRTSASGHTATSSIPTIASSPAAAGPTSSTLGGPGMTRSAGQFSIATVKGPQVVVYDALGGNPKVTIPNPGDLGEPLVMLGRTLTDNWVEVYLPIRPNGSTGWVKRADVLLERSRFYVRVELRAARITLWEGTTLLFNEPAAVGTAQEPTPAGLFYLRALVAPLGTPGTTGLCVVPSAPDVVLFLSGYHLNPPQCAEPAMSISTIENRSGSSRFEAQLGTQSTHGGIRISKETLAKLTNLLPLGTPVEVVDE